MRVWTNADYERFFANSSRESTPPCYKRRSGGIDAKRYERLCKLQAQAILREARAQGTQRQPLYVPGEKGNAFFKMLPLNVIGKQGGYCYTSAHASAKPATKRRTAKSCPHCGGVL